MLINALSPLENGRIFPADSYLNPALKCKLANTPQVLTALSVQAMQYFYSVKDHEQHQFELSTEPDHSYSLDLYA